MGCMGDRTKKEYRHKEKVTKNRGMRKLVRLGFFFWITYKDSYKYTLSHYS